MSEIQLQEPPVAVAADADIEFHRLARRWALGRRWRLIAGLLLAIVIYAVMIAAVFLIGYLALGADFERVFGAEDYADPLTYLLAYGTVALMLPAVLLSFWIVGCRPIGLLSSVAGRLRWAWVARLWPAALVIWAVTLAASLLSDPAALPRVATVNGWLLLAALAVTPFQAAAEEYVFRGALAQTVGAWLKNPWWAILLPVPLFVVGHGYDWVGLTGVTLFAVAAGWLTYRTGGLEAAIVMHVVNNTSLGVLAAFGLVDLNAMSFDPVLLVVDVAPIAVFVGWVEWLLWRQRRAAVGG